MFSGLAHLVILISLCYSSFLLFSKLDKGLIILLPTLSTSQTNSILANILLCSLPFSLYQIPFEILRAFYNDPDYGKSLFVTYKISLSTLQDQSLFYSFLLFSFYPKPFNPTTLYSLTLIFVLSQCAFIIGSLIHNFTRYNPMKYPGLIFSTSSCIYLIYYRLSL